MSSRLEVMRVIVDYCLRTGFTSFNYSQLRRYYYRGLREKRFKHIEWHTIERVLRKLSEEGLLLRNFSYRRGRLTVWFRVTDRLLHYFALTIEELKDPKLRAHVLLVWDGSLKAAKEVSEQ